MLIFSPIVEPATGLLIFSISDDFDHRWKRPKQVRHGSLRGDRIVSSLYVKFQGSLAIATLGDVQF
jgi:hypothetical protein